MSKSNQSVHGIWIRTVREAAWYIYLYSGTQILDITMYQGTGEITSLYRGIVKPGFRSMHFTVTCIGRAEKC